MGRLFLLPFPLLIPDVLDAFLEILFCSVRVVAGRVERLVPEDVGQVDEVVVVVAQVLVRKRVP